jgi:hypothetical protein
LALHANQPQDARGAVRTAANVRNRKLFDAEDFEFARGSVRDDGAAHASNADDSEIVHFHFADAA